MYECTACGWVGTDSADDDAISDEFVCPECGNPVIVWLGSQPVPRRNRPGCPRINYLPSTLPMPPAVVGKAL